MTDLPPCPHCHAVSMFRMREDARGTIYSWFNERGEYDGADHDKIYGVSNGVIRCGECGKIRHDVVRTTDNTIVVNHD